MFESVPVESIFLLTQPLVENPITYARDLLYQDLGLQPVDDPIALTLAVEKLVQEVHPKDTVLPKIRLLRRGDKVYYEFIHHPSRMSVIVEADDTFVPLLPGVVVRKIEHIFFEDTQGVVLDFMSLFGDDRTPNYLSLNSSLTSLFQPHHDTGLNKVILSVPLSHDTGQHKWDFDFLKYRFLHENSHAFLFKVDNNNYTDERLTNAVALQITKKVMHRYPGSNFLNSDSHKAWIDTQLHQYELQYP